MIQLMLSLTSGPLREELVKFAKAFREKARSTPNPVDDFVGDALCWILGVP